MTQEDATRKAGRGGLAVAGAKIYFIVLGLVQQIVLPRVLGLDGYGALSRVLSLASVHYNPITTTSIQAVSRSVVEAPSEELPGTVRRILSWHLVLGLILSAWLGLNAPMIARWAGAGHVETPLRLMSGVLFVYALYTPL